MITISNRVSFMNLMSERITIKNAKIIEANIFTDERGLFTRLFDDRNFDRNIFYGLKNINLSRNISKGTVRGLHMQKNSASESKIISCIKGEIIDLFVDCRIDSPSFGHINTIKLSEKKSISLLVPRGCLHSFLTLSDNTDVVYFTDNYYSPKDEICVSPISEEILNNFKPHKISICSNKDKNADDFSNFMEKLKKNIK